ncbi:major facilitator superfamily domain-containing protein [Lineolata rhizophorae]|uniref:Major facilitator superfamily domain-containing protein n=1 Tax=Lineolata rhizophorae TaxID=578093 RepID=A0A6A6NMA4_9PEZI|nr:major facilitator superfamily domain-containing protein [Lineolata rhizophorae]
MASSDNKADEVQVETADPTPTPPSGADSEHEHHHHGLHIPHHHHGHHDWEDPEKNPVLAAAQQNAVHIDLTWRSWVVVFCACFAIFSQIFVTVAAGSVIAFIIRDLGQPAISGWIIQGPLLMQSALAPSVGRLSDVLDRKYMATIPPIIAFAGAIVCATAPDMNTLIGGGILIGITLSTTSIVQAIPPEVLPLKYRPLANGFCGVSGSVGGLVGAVGAGAVTTVASDGWRYIFWMQAAFHGATALGFALFYWPAKSDYGKMTMKQVLWAIDPIGAFLFISATTILLLSLNWAAGTYPWDDAHVAAPLTIGCVILVVFGVYEWKGRSDGIVSHIFFKSGPNFPLAVFCYAVEGWIFYSAVNAITPQIVLQMGWETDAFLISVRQLSYSLVALFTPLPVALYATRFKDIRTPLVITFTIFLVANICYTLLKPSWDSVQIGINVLSGIGQAGPLTLLPAAVQFTAPHSYLSTATGLAFSARAIGGAFGSAVLDAIIYGHLNSDLIPAMTQAALDNGVAEGSDALEAIVAAAVGQDLSTLVGADIPAEALAAVTSEYRWTYARAYRLAWDSIIPFTVIAIICCALLRGVKQFMTEKVEATVERPRHVDEEKKAES